MSPADVWGEPIDLTSQGPVLQSTDQDLVLSVPTGSVMATTDRLVLPLFEVFNGEKIGVLSNPHFTVRPDDLQIIAHFRERDTRHWYGTMTYPEAESLRTLTGVLIHLDKDGNPRAWSGRKKIILHFQISWARGYSL